MKNIASIVSTLTDVESMFLSYMLGVLIITALIIAFIVWSGSK